MNLKVSTGVGYTFETLFGIRENNIPIPDIGGRVEIKTIRKDSQSLVTLFTFNRGVWNTIHLIDTNTGKIVATWDVYVIVGKFMVKLSRLLIVFADRKVIEGKEHFHYNEAYLLTDPSPRSFIKAFKKSLIGIDLRMHLKENGAVRNRGTAFRVRERDLIELYEHRRRLI